MSWTYTGSPFSGTPPYAPQVFIDSVRFLIGDTNNSDQQLADGEINGLGSINDDDPYQVAIASCDALIARYARQVNKTTGDLTVGAATRVDSYTKLKHQLERQAIRLQPPTPYAGGQSASDMQVDESNDDLIQPNFSLGMMDDPGEAPDFNGPIDTIFREGADPGNI